MIPAASVTSLNVKPAQPMTSQAALRTAQSPAPEAARASVGEKAAANVRAETAKAINAPEQSTVVARLRDQETSERTARAPASKDAPTGPPPSFEESPLERQARVAFDPPDAPEVPQQDVAAPATATRSSDGSAPEDTTEAPKTASEPPPTRTERAEASFAETRELAEPKEPAHFNVAS